MAGKQGRLFFTINSLRHRSGLKHVGFDVLRSYSPTGFFNSGFSHLRVSPDGTLELMSAARAHELVANTMQTMTFMVDTLDPGYNT
jgi:hypothetical protein